MHILTVDYALRTCGLQRRSKCVCISEFHINAVILPKNLVENYKQVDYRSQSITLMSVMFLSKLTCVESKNDVSLHVQPRTPYVK